MKRGAISLRSSRCAYPAHGGLVPLSSVAHVTIGSGPAQIDRFDRSRNINIEAELGGLPLGGVQQQVNELPSIVNLPAGIRKIDSGDGERMKELFGSFGLAMATGILCVYLVLVLLFKDFLQPITILAALPLSVGGAFLALLLCRQYMSMPAMIGLLMLMGITTKNSILLVEYAIVAMRDRGMEQTEALLDACRKRARPIVMTTLAMIAGMSPVALGIDADTQLPFTDGDRRDRRPDYVDVAQPRRRTGGFHVRLSCADGAGALVCTKAAPAGPAAADRPHGRAPTELDRRAGADPPTFRTLRRQTNALSRATRSVSRAR